MRIFKNELYKLFSKKIFIICLVAAFCINGFVLICTKTTDYSSQAKQNNSDYYISLIENCNASDNPSGFLQSELSSLYSELEKSDENKNVLLEKITLITELNSQNDYIQSYDEFISGMQSRADSQLTFSIFAKPDSFSYNNIEQTPLDFEHLKGVELKIGNNSAVETATQFEVTDYLLIILVALICILLFCVERENGLYPLVRCTKKGRLSTVIAKLLAVTVVTAATAMLFYLSDILISGAFFGFGDMGRFIQSISIFMECSLKVTVIQYLLLWIFGKVITFCCFALLMSFAFTAIKTAAKVYAAVIAFLAVEISTCLFIDGTSVFSFFKYVNLIYFLSGNNLFGKYLNINFFSRPVNVISVWTAVMLLFAVIGIAGSTILFVKSSQTAKKSALLSRVSDFVQKRLKIRGSVKIFSGEAYKHYKTSLAILALAALALFAASNLTDDLSIHFNDSAESAYNAYMQDIEGVIDSDTEEFFETEQQYFDGLEAKRQEIYNDDSLTDEEKSSQTSYITALLDGKGKAFTKIQEQRDFATAKSEAIGSPPALINELVCKRLTEDTYREWLYFTLLIAVIIFCTSNIFACEYKRSMVNLIRCNRRGKGRLIATKLFTVMLTAVISFVLVYLPYFINFILTFGTDSFSIPLAYMTDFGMLTSCVTAGQYILIAGAVHFTAAIAATAVVFMFSLLLKNNIITMIVSSGIMLIPALAVMELDTVRTVELFKNDVWQTAVPVIILLCVIFTAASIAVVFIKFSNLKRRKSNVNA